MVVRGTPETPSDEELMSRVAASADVGAFDALYRRYADRAYRVARSVCGDSRCSEDAVQEGFLSIWRSRAGFRPGGNSFRAWAMAIVYYSAIDALRRESAVKRPRLVAVGPDEPTASTASLEDQAVARSEAEVLRASLARLPAPQAQIINLAFFGELSHSEIAEQLNMPLGTVKGRMRLGLEKLRGEVEKST